MEDAVACMVVMETDIDNSSEDVESESLAEMSESVKVILKGLGEDPSRDGLQRTPLRVARALRFATKGTRQSAKDIVGRALFAEERAGGGDAVMGWGGGVGGMVVVRDVDLFSCCRGCLLPFRIKCHMAYIPAGSRVVGLSKLPRIAEAFSRRLQTPQRLANELTNAIFEACEPLGVAVALESWHLGEVDEVLLPVGMEDGELRDISVNGRGVVSVKKGGGGGGEERRSFQGVKWKNFGGPTGQVTCKGIGAFSEKGYGELWAEFGSLLDIEEDRWHYADTGSVEKLECDTWQSKLVPEGRLYSSASLLQDPRSSSLEEMVNATKSLLQEVGEDLGQGEAESTARKFVQQLMISTRGNTWTLGDVLEAELGLENGEGESRLVNGGRESRLVNGEEESRLVNGEGESRLVNGERESRLGNGERESRLANGEEFCVRRGGRKTQDFCDVLDQIHVEVKLPVASLCEHHLLPFFGHVHVGYMGPRVQELGDLRCISRSKLERIVELYGCRPQIQERLTRQIAEAVATILEGLGNRKGERIGESGNCETGVVVVVEASHMCMVSRGIEKASSITSTIAALGSFSSNHRLRLDFLTKLSRQKKGRISSNQS